MSKTKKKPKPADRGYPFDTGDWDKWSNRKRLDWMVNLRDKLRDNYKEKFNITDETITQLSADIVEMEKVVFYEEYNAAYEAAQNMPTPREKCVALGKLIDDICANDYYKARSIGFTDEQIEKMREDTDKYNQEIEEWERREQARQILGINPLPKPKRSVDDDFDDVTKLHVLMAMHDVDDSALKAAIERGDEESGMREFDIWHAKLEAKAEKDPIFAAWLDKFSKDQERLLRWDDVIEDEKE